MISDVSLVEFLLSQGLIRGDKIKGGMKIPGWILRKPAYTVACVRGLMDTDGCLYIHKHFVSGKEYRNIGLCFSSYSPTLLPQVATIFEEFGIIPHISRGGRHIYVYKASDVLKYLTVFGTSNERIASVYQNWKRG